MSIVGLDRENLSWIWLDTHALDYDISHTQRYVTVPYTFVHDKYKFYDFNY